MVKENKQEFVESKFCINIKQHIERFKKN